MTLAQRAVTTNGIPLMVTDEGEGPLVLLLHGFPETSYSWRHQIGPLTAAGYRVAAPDQRGYGHSGRPADVGAYTIMHLVGDLVGLLAALGEDRAVVVGHDWGATVAWNFAQMRPDLVRAVVGLSVPPAPRGDVPLLRGARERTGGRFYTNAMEAPGVADGQLARDTRAALSRIYYGISADDPRNPARPLLVPEGGGLLDAFGPVSRRPSWLTEEDLDVYTERFEASGFTGPLNWYRNLDVDWELTAPFEGAPLPMPAFYIGGDRDPVLYFPGLRDFVATLPQEHPAFRPPVILPGCGHWIQQEHPARVNELLLDFLASVEEDSTPAGNLPRP